MEWRLHRLRTAITNDRHLRARACEQLDLAEIASQEI